MAMRNTTRCTFSGVLVAVLSSNLVPTHSFVLASTLRVGWMSLRRPGDVRYHQASSAKDSADEEPDLFEYFDPLLSPHAYPNGISADRIPLEVEGEVKKEKNKDNYNPKNLGGAFGFEDEFSDDETVPGTDDSDVSSTAVEEEKTQDEEVDLFDVFDPTLSPHMYPNGIPSTKTKSTRVVGILLMDHGSRNQASNDRLHELAKRYQSTVGTNIVVQASHMELASPSIEEGLEALLASGVDEIVCHPYFLSPHGRHVSEDIPRIVQESIESLKIDIPIVTTDPVGAHTDIMISAIQTVVEQSSATLQQRRS